MTVGAFRWDDWNIENATKHGCTLAEIEALVRREVRGNRQRRAGDEKWIVQGGGRVIDSSR